MVLRPAILLLGLLVLVPSSWAATYYVRPDGDDAACDGLTDAAAGDVPPACAFRTLQRGVDLAGTPGDTVLIHAGTYSGAVSVRVSGTADGITTIKGFPGETVIIDTAELAFRTPGNNDWEPVDASIGEYRSVGEHAGTRVFGYVAGIEGYENERVLLIPYADTRDEPLGGLPGFSMFRATTDVYVDATTPFYVGPGIWLGKECVGGSIPGAACEISTDCREGGTCTPTGRVHIRLAKTADLRATESRYGTVLGSENADPRDYSINLSLAENTMRIFGSHLRFENLTFNHSRHTIALESGAHHVTFDGVTVWAGSKGIVADPPVDPPHDITVTRSRIYGDSPNWIFWSDAKNPPYPAELVRSTLIDMREGAHDWEISYCHVRGGFDGIGTNDREYNISIHHNRIENMGDDAFEIEGLTDIGRISVFENYIGNSLKGFAPGQDSPTVTGPIFFYRNVVVPLREPPVNRKAELNDSNGGTRHGYGLVFKQHSPHTFYYHNTVILLGSHRKGMNIVPGDPGEQAGTYVFNNIYVKVNGVVQGPYLTGPGQIVDHDLYWKMNTDDGEPLVDEFDTVTDLGAATGIEANGIGETPGVGTSPRFRDFALSFDKSVPTRWTIGADQEVWSSGDFLLDGGSPAIGAGRSLPTHPVFGTMPDSRPSHADLGAIPSGASASEWDAFPFDQGRRGPFGGPDLVVEALTSPPGGALRGTRFSVTDTVSNLGAGAAGISVTGYYLSLDRLRDGADVLLGENRAVPDLGPESGSTGDVTVTIPPWAPPGTYYLLACADSTGLVPEPREANNCRASQGQVRVTAPDLVETILSDPPQSAVSGDVISISDMILNQGTGPTGSPIPRYRPMGATVLSGGDSNTGYFLSIDGFKDGADILLDGTRRIPALPAGASFAGTATVTIPARTPSGTYSILACADLMNLVDESDESNNCLASTGRMQVLVRDLVETAVTDPPATVVAGNGFPIMDTIQNQGQVTAGSSTTRYYLSIDAFKSATDTLMSGTRPVSSLSPGATSSGTITVTVPSATAGGLHFLLACADDREVVAEGDETNNCRPSAGRVQVLVKDLVTGAVSNPPPIALIDSDFAITDTVLNQGQVTAGSSTSRYYLSLDTLKDGTDTLLIGTRSMSSLLPGSSNTGADTSTIPASTQVGLYYLLACADDTEDVTEGDETNNCLASSGQVQVTAPDLVEIAVADPPAIAAQGSSIFVRETAKNQGSGPAGSSTTRYYLSLDAVRDPADKKLSGTRPVSALAPGAESPGTDTVTVPTTTNAGVYYLLACADDVAAVLESDELNNCTASAGRIQITAPDLVETAVTDPPATAAPGGTFPVMDIVTNQGPAPSGTSTTRYYLSTDTTRNSTDVLSGTRSVPGLGAGAGSAGTVTVTVPTSITAGNYYLLACADDTGSVTEDDESNNCLASANPLLVALP